jgi:alcohol dehydrogenase (cytochrome c)
MTHHAYAKPVVLLRFGAAVLFVCAAAVSQRTTLRAGQLRSVMEGVFAADQAEQGRTTFANNCAMCHGSGLEGSDLAPALAGSDFAYFWKMATLAELVDKITKDMPPGDLPRMNRQQATQLVAYILQVNKAPAGTMELSQEEAAQKQISMALPDAPADPASAPAQSAQDPDPVP